MDIKDMYIVGLGEALWDVLPKGKQLGGAPANFAYHAGQHGIKSVAVSALGRDALAEETIAQLEAKHLNYVMPHVDFPTGTVQVTLDSAGVPTYDIKQGAAWDNMPFTPEVEAVAKKSCAVCWGSLAQRSEVSRESIYRFLDTTPQECLKIFDINLRQNFYTAEIICKSLNLCDILKINEDEIEIIGQMFNCQDLDIESRCRLILEKYNLRMVILTCGTNGSYVFSQGGKSFQPTPKVKVADTVGAGDSFTGTFCASILKGKSIAEAHKLAVEVSAYVCTQAGAMPEIPSQFTERS